MNTTITLDEAQQLEAGAKTILEVVDAIRYREMPEAYRQREAAIRNKLAVKEAQQLEDAAQTILGVVSTVRSRETLETYRQREAAIRHRLDVMPVRYAAMPPLEEVLYHLDELERLRAKAAE